MISLDEQIAYMRAQVSLEPSVYRKAALLSLRRLKRIEELMRQFKPMSHYECEDPWYSCPKSEEGCSDSGKGNECLCGADEYNALLKQVEEEVK